MLIRTRAIAVSALAILFCGYAHAESYVTYTFEYVTPFIDQTYAPALSIEIPTSEWQQGLVVTDPFFAADWMSSPYLFASSQYFYSYPSDGVAIEDFDGSLLPCQPSYPDGTNGSCSVAPYWATGVDHLNYDLTPEGNLLVGSMYISGQDAEFSAASNGSGLWTFLGYIDQPEYMYGCGTNRAGGLLYVPCTASGYFVGPVAPVPEPSPWALAALGLACLAVTSRRRRPLS
jgi:MYXO-CTERM domain-containing protein